MTWEQTALTFFCILAIFLVLIWSAFGERKGGKVNG